MPLLSRYFPGNYLEHQLQTEKRYAGRSFRFSLFLVVILWMIKLIEYEFGFDFAPWGILPRTITGLRGILLSPLIHGSFGHLAANTMPLMVLTFSLFYFYRRSASFMFALIYLFSGLFLWLGGREAMHIGISGVIYGLAAFLFLSGVLSRHIGLLTVSLLVALFYGGLVWGIFPVKPEISWEAHLWGAITGFGLAYLFRSPPPVAGDMEEEEPDDQEWQHYDIEEADSGGSAEKQ